MKKIIILIALAVGATGLLAQDAPPADRPMPNGLGLGLFNKRVDVSSLPADLQTLVTTFREQRATFLAERKAMFDQLKDMTAEERKAALEQLRTQIRDELQAQRDLARQIREQLRTLREERRNNPGG